MSQFYLHLASVNWALRLKIPLSAPLCFLVLALTNLAVAFSPSLQRVEPRGGQVGTKVQLELIGQRLYRPTQLLFYRDGLQVLEVRPGKDPKKAFATLHIPPQAALGEYPFRVLCQEGLSELRTFWVGQFPTIYEARTKNGKREANDTFATAQRIATDVTVQGTTQREDADYFKLHLRKGQRLSVEVEGMRLGRVMFDPLVSILDGSGKELARNDDSPLLGRDCAVSIICPETADYVIYLRESAFEGSSQAQYRLHVGHFPRPTRMTPIAAHAGDAVTFTFEGDPAGPFQKTTVLTETTRSVFPEYAGYLSPSGLPLRIIPPHAGAHFQGFLTADAPVHNHFFEGKKGQRIAIEAYAHRLGSRADTSLSLRRKGTRGKALASNQDRGPNQPDSALRATLPENGTYALTIRDHLRRHGPEFFYHVEVTPDIRPLTATVPEANPNDTQSFKQIQVPRGSRIALVPNIQRNGYQKPLTLSSPKLPEGVQAIFQTHPRQTNQLPILFEARADAPLSASLVPLELRDPDGQRTGPVLEKIAHVHLRNLGTFHETTSDRLAMAVIESAPFSISLTCPPVIPRDGVLELRVNLLRKEGFTGRVRLSLPWRPNGLSAPNEVEIPSGKDHAFIQLNTKSDALLGTHQIIVTALGETDRGPIRLSSRFHALTVIEPLISARITRQKLKVGSQASLPIQLTSQRGWKGKATLTLKGLPHGVSAQPVHVTSDETVAQVPLTLSDQVRPRLHRNLFIEATVPYEKGTARHLIARGGVLQVTRPDTTAAR